MPNIIISDQAYIGWQKFQSRRAIGVDGVPGEQTLREVLEIEGELATGLHCRQGDFPRPGPFFLSDRSIERLEGVHDDLLAVVHCAIRLTSIDFGVTATGGVRTQDEQNRLVDDGKSKSRNSRHLTGHAVDVYAVSGGKADWSIKAALKVHEAFDQASKVLGVTLRWGGDWDGDGEWRDERFLDAFHHELPRGLYGNSMASKSTLVGRFLESLA